MNIKATPDGYHSLTAYLTVDDAAIAFYIEALGATELYRLPMGDRIGHAEIQIGDSRLMLSDEFPAMNVIGPRNRGGPTASFLIYVADVDAAFDRAIEAGGSVQKPVENQFYGDRSGTFIDPFGHKWTIATHVEDVSPQEMAARLEKLSGA